MKLLKSLAPCIFVVMLAVVMSGCPINIDMNQNTTETLVSGAGANAAFFTLKNNPDDIPEVKIVVDTALGLAEQDGVDAVALSNLIIQYVEDKAKDLKYADEAPIILMNLNILKDAIVIDATEDPDAPDKYLTYITCFLEGAKEGIAFAELAVLVE